MPPGPTLVRPARLLVRDTCDLRDFRLNVGETGRELERRRGNVP